MTPRTETRVTPAASNAAGRSVHSAQHRRSRRLQPVIGAVRLRILTTLAVAAALILAGCARPARDDADDIGVETDVGLDASSVDGAIPADTGQAPNGAEPVKPPGVRYANLPLVRRIPATAPFVMVLGSAANWAEWINLGALLDATGGWGTILRARSRARIGHDLTDPAQWPRLWVDPGRFMTAAVLDIDPLTVAFGAKLIDADAMRTLIYVYHAGREDLREVQVGGATVVGRVDGWGPVFAWEGDEFWVVFGQGLQRGEAFHHALSLARPDILLAEMPDVQLVLEELVGGRAVTGILNIPALVERGLRTEEADPSIAVLREKEDFARRFDEFPRANRLMSDRLRRQVMDLVTQQRRLSEQVLRSAFYPFGPAAFSVRIEANAVQAEYVQRLVPGTLPATSLRVGAETSLGRHFPRPPSAQFAVSFDPEVAATLARGLALVANRNEIALFEAELRARTGVDVRRDLLETSAGRFEVAVDVDPARFAEAVTLLEVLHRVSVLARWGIKDATAVKLALGRIERGVDWVEPAGEGRFVVNLPPLPQIWIQVVEGAVYASFDAALLARVEVEEAGGTAAGPREAEAEPAPAGDGSTDASPMDAGSPNTDGGVPEADAAAAGDDVIGGSEQTDGSEVIIARVLLPAFEPVLESLVAAEPVEPVEPAENSRGPGSFAFERLRGLALARNIKALKLRGALTREALSVRVRLESTPDGVSTAAAAVIRASMPPPKRLR